MRRLARFFRVSRVSDIYIQGEFVVKLRLKRMGKKNRPYYRIVAIDSRRARDGKSLEDLGYYHPVESEERQIKVDRERVDYWLGVGAKPSDTVRRLLNKVSS